MSQKKPKLMRWSTWRKIQKASVDDTAQQEEHSMQEFKVNHERGSWDFQDNPAVPSPKAGSCYVLLTGLSRKNLVSCIEDQSSRVTSEAGSTVTLPSPTSPSHIVSSCWGQDSSKVEDVCDQLTKKEVKRKEEKRDICQEGIECNGEREQEKLGRRVKCELQLQFQPLQEHYDKQKKKIITETIQQTGGYNGEKCPTSIISLCKQVPDYDLFYRPVIMCHHCQKELINFDKLRTRIQKKHMGRCKICQVMDRVQERYEAKLNETSTIAKYSSNICDRMTENSIKYSDDELKRKSIENDIVEIRSEVKIQKLFESEDSKTEEDASQGSSNRAATPVLLGAFREFAIAERAKLQVMNPEMSLKKVRTLLQCSWRELGVDARRDWGKWARRNYQIALLRQSQESHGYSSGDEDFL